MRKGCLMTKCVILKGLADGVHDPYYCASHAKSFFGNVCPGEEAAPTKLSNPKDSIGDTKVPMWLLSTVAKAEWALAQFAGMLKYGAWNWRVAGVRTSVYLSAMERHLEAYKGGEELDPVDGTLHLANIMACCAILIDAKAAGKLNDDRPPVTEFRETFDRVQKQMIVLKAQYADKNPEHFTNAK